MEWFYVQDGQKVGPVSKDEIQRLIVQKLINQQTLVWTPAFGEEWRTAVKAGLFPSRIQFKTSAGETFHIPKDLIEKIKKSSKVPSLWGWILLLVPSSLSIFIQYYITLKGPLDANAFLIISVAIYSIFFISFSQDRNVIRKANFMPPSFWWWLFIPGYFWKRVRILGGRGFSLFIVAVLIFMVNLGIILFGNSSDIFDASTFPSIQKEHYFSTQFDQKQSSLSKDSDAEVIQF